MLWPVTDLPVLTWWFYQDLLHLLRWPVVMSLDGELVVFRCYNQNITNNRTEQPLFKANVHLLYL